jgi:hypothetical protein
MRIYRWMGHSSTVALVGRAGSHAVVLLFVLAALWRQASIGAAVLNSDLTGADPPAHFTTGVMIYDYFRQPFGTNPLAFAESFYVRFPKVALGHWPPVYYLLAALWYLLFGATIASARALSALICFAVGIVLFWSVRRWSASVALVAAGGFFLAPAIQSNAWLVMSDLLVGLFVAMAVLAFARFLRSTSAVSAAWFTLWTVLAILTKGSAWSLGLFAVITPLALGDRTIFRNRFYWLSGAVIVAVCVPFYIAGSRVAPETLAGVAYTVAVSPFTRFKGALQGFEIVPRFAVGIAMFACLDIWGNKARMVAPEHRVISVAAAVFILSQILFLGLFPLTMEERYFLPSAAMFMLLFARGLVHLRMLAARWRHRAELVVAPATACVLLAVSGFDMPERIYGYGSVARAIPIAAQPAVVLISSDASGEGTLIAARLEIDRSRRGVLLRGSKILYTCDWSGTACQQRFKMPAEVLAYLESAHVRFIVLDASTTQEPAQLLLRAALEASPDQYPVLGTFPVLGRAESRGPLVLIGNKRASPPGTVEVDLGPARGGRKLRVSVEP